MSTAPASIQPGSYCNHVAVHRALDAADLLREQKIGGSGLSVLIGIARHCNQEDECWPSYKCIAEEMLMSKSTVGRALAELIDVGAVQVSKGDARASNSYIFQPECIHPREIRDRTTEVDSQSATMTLGSPRYSESHHGTQSATMTTQSPMVTHEVVKEVVKEKVNEGVKPDSKPAGKVGLVTFKGPPVKGKAKEESLRTPDAKTSTPPVSLRFDQEVKATTTPAHPEMPTPVDPTPESRLANLYFTSLGEPRKHKEAVRTNGRSPSGRSLRRTQRPTSTVLSRGLSTVVSGQVRISCSITMPVTRSTILPPRRPRSSANGRTSERAQIGRCQFHPVDPATNHRSLTKTPKI